MEREKLRLERLEDRTVMTAGIGLSFTGNTFGNSGGVTPPDTQGDVGPNHIVNFTNGSFGIMNKTTGALISRTSDATFWSSKVGVSFSGGLSDPRIVFDTTTNRWFACEITTASTNNVVLLGRSDTSDPTGIWKGVSFTGSPGGFADYPTLGVDADAIYIGINNFSGTTGVTLHSIPKTSVTAATPTTTGIASFLQLSANTFGFTLQGATSGNASIGHGSIIATDNDTFGLTRFNVNGSSAAGATLSAVTTMPVASYGANVQAHQPDGTVQVSTLDDRFSGSAYRVGNFIYVAHCVGLSSRAAVNVYVVNETTNTVVATATIGDGVHDFFQPTIAANSLGNVVVGYNRSGAAAGEFIGSYASIGTFNGTTLTLESPLLVSAGLALYHLQAGSGQRWGDYSATRPDVSNPSTFWTFQEFVPSANNYATSISQLNVVNTTVTLDGSNNLVITDTAPNGKNDLLTIQSDTANSRFVITDPVNFIGSSIAGVTGDKTHTVFVPFASVAGTGIAVNTLAGTDSVTVDNSLGTFTKTLTVDGGLGTDSLSVNGTTTADAMTINATTVAFGTFNLTYAGTESASIDGLAGGDTYNFSPSAATTFTIVGNTPAFPTLTNADYLNLNLTGVTGQTLGATGNGAGAWTFSNRNSVTFSGIERMTPGITISGRVFQDLDNNGNDNGGTDPGMAGVTVNLDSLADGTTDLTVISVAGGGYSFADLAPGSYRVRQVVPGGFTQSSANPADLTFSAPPSNTGLNFGNFVADVTPPTITSVEIIAPDPRNTQVTSWDVTFSEAVNLATLTSADFTFTVGGPNLLTGSETVALVSGTTYRISGLPAQSVDGTYTLTVVATGVQDLAGNAGVGPNGSDSFTRDATGPSIVSVETITPNPRTIPVATIDVTFDQPIDLASFTVTDIGLTLNAGAVTFSGNETFTSLGGNSYRVSGLTEETGVDGSYVFTVTATGINDALGNAGTGSGNTAWTKNTADTTAPTITGVSFGGSTWSAAFNAAAGDATYGFPASTGASQLASMPWSNLNRAVVKFSEPVQALVGSDIRINRLTGGLMTQGTDYTFALNGSNDVLTITFLANLGTDKYLIDLDGNGGATAIRDIAGNFLAGTWTEGVSTFPTAGAAAQDFQFRYVVGVGDATRNGQVRNNDVNQVRGQLFNDLPSGTFDIFSDSNGDGLIRNVDVNTARANLFNDPPAGGGPARPVRGPGASRNPQTVNGGLTFSATQVGTSDSNHTTVRRLGSVAHANVLDQLFAEV